MCLPDFITKQADPTAILDFQLKEVILPAIEIELNRSPILQEIKQDIKEMDQKITRMEQDITGIKNTLSDGFGLMSQSLVLHGNILQKL